MDTFSGVDESVLCTPCSQTAAVNMNPAADKAPSATTGFIFSIYIIPQYHSAAF